MRSSKLHATGRMAAALVLPLLLVGTAAAADDNPFATAKPWEPPSAAEVEKQVFDWLAEIEAEDATVQQAKALWARGEDEPELTGPEMLERVAKSVALAHPQARQLLENIAEPREDGAELPAASWLSAEETPGVVGNNLRLLYARWLVHEELIDEALEQLEGLEAADVADPGSLFFYRAVALHKLAEKDDGVAALDQLLAGDTELPRRYVTLAKLMQADLGSLRNESLDHISRWMDDIRRRLDHGRTGEKVQKREDDVIAALDKLIEELEKQQQQQQGGGGGGGGGQQPGSQPGSGGPRSGSPAGDSRILGGTGPGNVDRRDIGRRSGWGDLPPKERERALQQLAKEFPSHYRDVIQEYFRKLASEGSER